MTRLKISEDLLHPSVEMEVLQKSHLIEEDFEETRKVNHEIICDQCGSQNCYKRGKNRNNFQQYRCKSCQKVFIAYPLVNEEGKKIKCPDCNSIKYKLSRKYKGEQKYRCEDCNRRYVISLHEGDEPDFFNKIICKWCSSKNLMLCSLKKTEKQKYKCKDCQREFTIKIKNPYPYLEKPENTTKAKPKILFPYTYPKEFDFNLDIWTTEQMGYQDGIHNDNIVNFSYIQQPWLKYYFKKFIVYQASIRLSWSTLRRKTECIKIFSKFLTQISYNGEFKDINRQLIIDFLFYLKKNNYAYSSHKQILSTIKTFFEIGIVNNWFQVELALIRPEDGLKPPKYLPRFIPEDIIKQLMENLHYLPKPIRRMVLVDIECGFRIGELTRLKVDCLKSNEKGGWYIQYKIYKMNKEHTKPISHELAKVIQEQQAYIKQLFGPDFPYLFCGRAARKKSQEFVPEPKLMTSTSFMAHLKRLAYKCNIKDSSGKIWNFQSHQFRHTVGTRMINAGVPQHIVQRYLGHESPDMTMVYAYIFDDTLRKEIEKYHESKVVNFQGHTVSLSESILSSNDDLEWFKKNIQARALEHGYCARPKVLGDCDIPGFDGCYNCPHWRTNSSFLSILKDTLDRTNKVIDKARNCGWELQVKKNQPIQENLEKVIKSLEEKGNE